jgi:hypothetical protein
MPLSRIASFHGHLGPYVVLGYRMGLLARKVTGTAGYFDIEARPSTRGKPPESCFVDGIQLGTGATTGKGNLKVETADAPPFATFAARGGKPLVIRLRPGVPERIREGIAAHGVGPMGLWTFSAPAEQLFEVVAP